SGWPCGASRPKLNALPTMKLPLAALGSPTVCDRSIVETLTPEATVSFAASLPSKRARYSDGASARGGSATTGVEPAPWTSKRREVRPALVGTSSTTAVAPLPRLATATSIDSSQEKALRFCGKINSAAPAREDARNSPNASIHVLLIAVSSSSRASRGRGNRIGTAIIRPSRRLRVGVRDEKEGSPGLFSFGASESSCYARRVWCQGLAGCSASRAAQRRPSALLAIRQGECCFRLADRRRYHRGDVGLEQPRGPQFRRHHGGTVGGSPESPPPPRCR